MDRLQPHPRKADWFLLPLDRVKQVADVPIIRGFNNVMAEVPRSVLPLLEEGQAFIDAEREASNLELAQRCEARNQHTEPLGFLLRPHQHIAVEFAARRRGLLIADAPRVGKTLESLMCHDPSRGKLFVSAPLPTREVWHGWIKRVFPDLEVSVITGKTFDPAKLEAPIVLGHYDILPAWQALGVRIGTLILDEAHVLSNRRSQRTKAAVLLASRSEVVLALTGTPLWNKPQMLWPLLGLVAPGQFGSYTEFGCRYTNATPTAYGFDFEGTTREAELRQRLTEVMLFRRWEDISKDLPAITRDLLVVDLTPQQRLEVDLIAEAGRSANNSAATIGAIAQYRSALAALKVNVAIEAAKGDLEKGERVVLWTWHKKTAKHAYETLRKKYPAFLVTGDVGTQKREEALAAWKQTEAAVLIITISVGQVGIDLSAAHLAIFAEIDFTPALIAQAEMRTFAPTRPMNIRYVIADHPIERAIIDALKAKLDDSDRLGVPAAEAAIDVLKHAFALPEEEGDMDRLLRDLLASAAVDG